MENKTKQEYLKLFKFKSTTEKNQEETGAVKRKSNESRLTEEALKQALDIRKFEIEMYWKRATYFWTIIGVIFGGYFLLVKADGLNTNPSLIFLINCIGFIFSLSWFLVNRGSKFWQINWERHVDLLEDRIMGPLFKTIIQKNELEPLAITKEYNYSVSKINQILSFYVTIIWIGIGLNHLINIDWNFNVLISTTSKTIALIILTGIATVYLLCKGKSEVKFIIIKEDIQKNEGE